jgi:hypothetical protein
MSLRRSRWPVRRFFRQPYGRREPMECGERSPSRRRSRPVSETVDRRTWRCPLCRAGHCGGAPQARWPTRPRVSEDCDAFTDARESSPGTIPQSRSGALFLDEIEAMATRARGCSVAVSSRQGVPSGRRHSADSFGRKDHRQPVAHQPDRAL